MTPYWSIASPLLFAYISQTAPGWWGGTRNTYTSLSQALIKYLYSHPANATSPNITRISLKPLMYLCDLHLINSKPVLSSHTGLSRPQHFEFMNNKVSQASPPYY